MKARFFPFGVAASVTLLAASGSHVSAQASEGQLADAPLIEPLADLSQFTGRIIARVAVSVVGEPADTEPPPFVRAGDALSFGATKKALAALLETGRFARGTVLLSTDSAGLVVTFQLVPRKVIDSVELDLHGATIDVDGFLADLSLRKDLEIVPSTVEDKSSRARAFFEREGYPSATAKFTLRNTDDPLRVVVSLDVDPGPPRLLTERRFAFLEAPPPAVRALAESYSVRLHARVELDKLDKADTLLAEALRARNYVHAKVAHRLEENARGATLIIEVEQGVQLVPHFRGNDTFDAATLLAALDITNDADRSPGHWADRLRTFYITRGFYDAEVTPLTTSSPFAIQNVTLQIAERQRVHIAARHYPCLPDNDPSQLAGGPSTASEIDAEINSYLEEELPGAELLSQMSRRGVTELTTGKISSRPEPLALNPNATFVPDTFARGIAHLQDLYRGEGYLSAIVGPVVTTRATCNPFFPGGRCEPLTVPSPSFSCGYDATGVPTGALPTSPPTACVPDAQKGTVCSDELQVYVPILLGPRTILVDVAFAGVTAFGEQRLAEIAALPLGSPVSSARLEEARRHILDAYKEDGFAYAEVNFSIEPSLNHSRARVRFGVREGERVIVRAIEIRGTEEVSEKLIRSRVALVPGEPYRVSLVRRSQELLGALGVFSTVTVGLDTPEVHEPNKTVVIRVMETARSLTGQLGISTAEGPRFGLTYRNPNIGDAVSLNVNLRASILPNVQPFISPSSSLGTALSQGEAHPGDLVIARATTTVGVPDIGLGPRWRGQFDGLVVKDLQPDFTLYKGLLGGTLAYRPWKHVFMTFATDVEVNRANIFTGDNIDKYVASLTDPNTANAIRRLLLFPDGTTFALVQKQTLAWDTRDNIFNPHTGFLFSLGTEFVEWLCIEDCQGVSGNLGNFGEFVKLTQSFSEHVPIGRKVTLAVSLRFGEIIQLYNRSTTYPDRLFFLGGPDTNRGWALDSVFPADILQKIQAGGPNAPTPSEVPTRGGNLMFNPRAELRFPIEPPLDGVLFVDTGNVWSQLTYPFERGHPFFLRTLRTSIGTGLRVQTPVGPLAFDVGFKAEKWLSYEDDTIAQFSFSIGLY